MMYLFHVVKIFQIIFQQILTRDILILDHNQLCQVLALITMDFLLHSQMVEYVTIPFDVDNVANQSEIMNYVQAVLNLSSTSGVTVTIQDPHGYATGVPLTSPYTDNYFYGIQATNTYIDGLWHIVITNNSGSTRTVNDAKLRIKSTGFLRIGNGVIVDDNCHVNEATVKVLSDITNANPEQCGEYFWERVIKYQGTDWKGMKTEVCTHVIRWEHNTLKIWNGLITGMELIHCLFLVQDISCRKLNLEN